MSRAILPGSIVGVLGGGQLGRMFALAARRMGYRVHVYADQPDAPASQVADLSLVAPYDDLDQVAEFSRGVNVLTFEFENVPAVAAATAEAETIVRPNGRALEIAQHRVREKLFLADCGLPVTPFAAIESERDFTEALARIGKSRGVLKTARLGYDGKGQVPIDAAADLDAAWASLGRTDAILETFIDLEREISVIVARAPDGAVATYAPIDNTHRHHILDLSVAPAPIAASLADEAIRVAAAVVDALSYVGVLCVEFFVARGGRLMINEIAPRPHNSGHLTIDACRTSQFEQQVRAICGLPLGSTELLQPAAMANLLGDLWADGEPDWPAALAFPSVTLHLYGKRSPRPGRKMGHLTALGPNAASDVAARPGCPDPPIIPRMTNRWLPVVGGLCMNLALGSLYAWSVFVAPLEKEFGWTRAQTSWVFTIAVVCFAVTFVIAGQIQDRKGPRICALLGGLLVSGGFMLASQASSLMTLYIYFGVIVGIGNGFGYATPTPVGSKWFPDKRGLIIGLLVGGYGAGSAIIAPLAERQLLPAFGWRTTFQLLGAAFFVMTMIGTALLKNPPAGYRPPNWTPAAAAVTRKDMTAGEMVQTPTFYALWLAYACGTTGGLMTISQLAPFAKSAAIDTSAIFWITAIGNAGGRILSGWMSDTLGRVRTLQTMILLSALAMPALFLWRGYAMAFYALAALVYWCYGTQLSVFASTTADFYGTRNLGMNYGVLFSAWGVAGILGPAIAGRVYTSFGDYRYAFYSAAALALVGLISLTFAKAPTPKGVPT